MEFDTTVIGLVGIVLCILPFAVLHWNRNKNKKQLQNGLYAIASSVHSDVGVKDIGFNFAIGVSADKRHLLYYKQTKKNTEEASITFAEVDDCHLDTIKRGFSTKYGHQSVIEKLELTVLLKDKSKKRFEFYNENEKPQLGDELNLIKKWESLVHQCIHAPLLK
ncbi:hypothetical protein DN752_22580 [Echinicola strongylocentroti]|uniref:Uncharacterized protein n=1 Tax=Echinicola strongylocentroti TaxID=1795355 RepID=A0A2Z4IP82_9BACT|nr:hypothetical protein [Echinicola strongylocentroti]AWW32705.1 hypothetical protein DN752_22580 [Echinicola strongylocentroti]